MSAEKLKFELQINHTRLLKNLTSDVSIKTPAKNTAYGKVRIHVAYADILPSVADLLLTKAEYRLAGTFALTVEDGFSRRDFKALGESDPFSSHPEIKKRLEEIASSQKGEN
jgi:hypothetical protein